MSSIVISLLVPLWLGPGQQALATVPEGHEIVEGTLRFAPDGSRVAYVVARGQSFHPVVGQQVSDAYDEVAPPVLDSSGEHVFFRVMERNRKNEEEWTLLKDGKKLAEGGWIGPVTVSKEGVPAFWVFADSKKRGGCVLTYGKKKTKQWQVGDLDGCPAISSDGKLALSVATRDDTWLIVGLTDKGEEEVHGIGWIVSALPQPDGKGILATTLDLSDGLPKSGRPRRHFLRRMAPGDGGTGTTLGKTYLSAGSPCFSRDGQRIAFKVLGEGGMGVAVDEQEDAPASYRFVDELVFSPNGRAVAFTACLEGTLIFPPTFGADPKTGCEVLGGVAATSGKWVVVTDGARSAEYELVRLPTWSPEATTVAFAARQDGAWRLVAGDASSEPCDEIARVVWDEPGKIRYGCRVGRELQWRELVVR